MNTTLIRLMQIIFIFLICTAFEYKSYGYTNQSQKPKSKNTASHTVTNNAIPDTTFTLKIENEKRVVDEKLKAKLIREIKAAAAKHQLKKPYKIALGFTKGARDVETFLFGEQIFYTMAESGFFITGTPLDMPEETPNAIPQVKVINEVIYVILSRM